MAVFICSPMAGLRLDVVSDMVRTGGQPDWHNPRLPVARNPEPNTNPCDRVTSHTGGIRFELRRYGRTVGAIRLCEACIRSLVVMPDPDPLTSPEAA